MRKWKWIGHSLRQASESTEKAMEWNKHATRRGRSTIMWKGPFCRKQENAAKHAASLRGLRVTESDGDASQMPYLTNSMKGRTTKLLLRQQEHDVEYFMNSSLKNRNSSHNNISWHLLSFTSECSPQRFHLQFKHNNQFQFPNNVLRISEARI
jgi:hypothetical protein